jgi:hypothetical protein
VNARNAIRCMKWTGEKMKAGDTLTEEEQLRFEEAEEASLSTIRKYMRLGPEDWKYTPGEPFK